MPSNPDRNLVPGTAPIHDQVKDHTADAPPAEPESSGGVMLSIKTPFTDYFQAEVDGKTYTVAVEPAEFSAAVADSLVEQAKACDVKLTRKGA